MDPAQVEQIFHAVTELGIEHAELRGEGPTASDRQCPHGAHMPYLMTRKNSASQPTRSACLN